MLNYRALRFGSTFGHFCMALLGDRHRVAEKKLEAALGRIDLDVLAGNRALLSRAGPSHTINSRKHSLRTLIRDHLDPTVNSWLIRNGMDGFPKFSTLVEWCNGGGVRFLEDLARQGHPTDWHVPNEFSRTCDALIEFIFFCGQHYSDSEKVVRINSPRGEEDQPGCEREGWGMRKGTRSGNRSPSMPDYLIATYQSLRSENLCVACGQLTMAETERARLLNTKIIQPIRAKLKAGAQYYSDERGSSLYCIDHAESLSGSAGAKKGYRMRIRFLSLLLSMRRAGVAGRMNDLCEPAYEIEFARLAIRNPSCYRALKAVEDALPLHVDGEFQNRGPIAKSIFAVIYDIYVNKLKLPLRPYDVQAELSKHSV